MARHKNSPYYSIIADIDFCVGCHACEVACKQENNVPTGLKWISIVTVGPYDKNGTLVTKFVPVRCVHCTNPPCAEVCPEKAIVKRIDGIVLVKEELCIGCKKCIEACPFGAIAFSSERKLPEKCTLCVHRIEKGLEPACVAHCPTSCLKFGNINDVIGNLRKEKAERELKF